MSEIFLLTYLPVFQGKDPGLCTAGWYLADKIQPLLPENLPFIICGLGRRHRETASAFSFPAKQEFSPDASDICLVNEDQGFVLMPDGSIIRLEQYPNLSEKKWRFKALVDGLPEESLVITDPYLVKSLGPRGYPKPGNLILYNQCSGFLERHFPPL